MVATGDPWASMPTASMTESVPRPSVISRITSAEIIAVCTEIDGLHTAGLCPREAFGHSVNGDDPVA